MNRNENTITNKEFNNCVNGDGKESLYGKTSNIISPGSQY